MIVSLTFPTGDLAHNPSLCLTRNRTGDLLVCRMTPNPLNHTGQDPFHSLLNFTILKAWDQLMHGYIIFQGTPEFFTYVMFKYIAEFFPHKGLNNDPGTLDIHTVLPGTA